MRLGARLLLQSYQYPNFSVGADRVGGQLRGDKKCSFSGVTKYGRVWRKMPESDARRVILLLTDVQAELGSKQGQLLLLIKAVGYDSTLSSVLQH